MGLFDFLKTKKTSGKHKSEDVVLLQTVSSESMQARYENYPETIVQNSSNSILTPDKRYDPTRFSDEEDRTIRQVIENANKKYAQKYRALGLANETYPITYKARYILIEVLIQSFKDSDSPLDQIAVSFAYLNNGAAYRQKAIEYFEKAINNISISDLNKFASVSPLTLFTKVAEAYEKEHDYRNAIKWNDFIVQHGYGNTPYFIDKIKKLKEKSDNLKPVRRRTISERQIEFEKQVRISAEKYVTLVQKGSRKVTSKSKKTSKTSSQYEELAKTINIDQILKDEEEWRARQIEGSDEE